MKEQYDRVLGAPTTKLPAVVAHLERPVVPRINDNGARAKSGQPRTIPTGAGLVRLYADYLHGEYGELDSDYVLVNLWGEPRGHPLTYAAVYDLVKRLRRRTGIEFDPYWSASSSGMPRSRRPSRFTGT